MSKVTLNPSGNTVYVDDSKSLLEHLKANGVYVKSSCGGHASCTDCIVKVTSGTDNINEPTKDEIKLLGNVFHITKERLSCQCIVTGDITVDLSEQDLEADEQRRETKNKKFVAPKPGTVKVRKKEEFDKIIEERREKSLAKRQNKEDWHKHWEKEGVRVEKSLGGGKRPKKIKDID